MGDVIQALPVLRLLKRHLQDSEIYWWIESTLAPLLEGDADLSGVLLFERKKWAAPRNWLGLWRTVRWARAQRFDWVIDVQCLARSGMLAWLANGRFTLGLNEPREGARGFYDAVVDRANFHTHAVDWYLAALRFLQVPVDRVFEWLPPRKRVAADIREKWPIESRRWILLQPGARWANKRWPLESYSALLRQLTAAYPSYGFAVLGGLEDQPLGRELARARGRDCLDLTGQLSLPQMVEWIRASDLFITNDTGPMHVAAALNIPVVGLFGPTEPRRTGPYGQIEHTLQLNLPCVPCLSSRCAYAKPMECLRALAAETVLAAVRQRLAAA